MIDYRATYEAFVAAEAEAERRALGAGDDAWARAWQLEHAPSWLEFQELLWAVRGVGHVLELPERMGTVCSALALVAVLREQGVLELHDDGALRWRVPLFPEPAAPAVTAERAPAWMHELSARPSFGQIRTSLASSERRAAALLEGLPPFGRHVLFLGDDDLTSIVLAARRPGPVVVADVDPRVLEAVRRAREAWDLPLEAIELDVRHPLPASLRGGFDLVHCDPMDDGIWLELWLRRSMEACREQPGARVAVSVAPRRLGRRLLGLHALAQHGGFALHERHAALGRYPVEGVEGEFYGGHARVLAALGPAALRSLPWEVCTDLLVFRRQAAPWPMLWPQAWQEIRRAV